MGLHGAAPHAAEEGDPGYVEGLRSGRRRGRRPGWVAPLDGEGGGFVLGPPMSVLGAAGGTGRAAEKGGLQLGGVFSPGRGGVCALRSPKSSQRRFAFWRQRRGAGRGGTGGGTEPFCTEVGWRGGRAGGGRVTLRGHPPPRRPHAPQLAPGRRGGGSAAGDVRGRGGGTDGRDTRLGTLLAGKFSRCRGRAIK